MHSSASRSAAIALSGSADKFASVSLRGFAVLVAVRPAQQEAPGDAPLSARRHEMATSVIDMHAAGWHVSPGHYRTAGTAFALF